MIMQWTNSGTISSHQFVCGHCGNRVASASGFHTQDNPNGQQARIYICPHCTNPTFIHISRQIPGVSPGNAVGHLPEDISGLYLEARNAISIGAHTASVLACRKLLMNIAVSQGAKAGESFISYVEFLAKAGYIPPNGRAWVDHIRDKGNEATHEIKLMSAVDADELISFSEMLLKFIYEFPNKVPAKAKAT
jgi:hypothetical protein